MTLDEQIKLAKYKNWAMLISEKCDRICREKSKDPSLFIDMLNGNIVEQAQEEYCTELQNGKWDSMCMPVECNL